MIYDSGGVGEFEVEERRAGKGEEEDPAEEAEPLRGKKTPQDKRHVWVRSGGMRE